MAKPTAKEIAAVLINQDMNDLELDWGRISEFETEYQFELNDKQRNEIQRHFASLRNRMHTIVLKYLETREVEYVLEQRKRHLEGKPVEMGTITGRTSSSEPNMSNVPKEPEEVDPLDFDRMFSFFRD